MLVISMSSEKEENENFKDKYVLLKDLEKVSKSIIKNVIWYNLDFHNPSSGVETLM